MIRPLSIRSLLVLLAVVAGGAFALEASMPQDNDAAKLGYDDTPFLPGDKYRVHDGTRPQPPIVEPGTASTQDDPGKAPSDAIVLFDGSDHSAWNLPNGQDCPWVIEDGALVTAPGSGSIQTKQEFGDCQLHLDFSSPEPARGSGQGRANSGIMFFSRYEIQVLDSFDNPTYPDGQAGAIYGQFPPMVNASRPPGQWQTFDIIFKAPRFAEDGSVTEPARTTILQNGVLLHHDQELLGSVAFRAVGQYQPHGPKGPLMLQDHGDPVRFRNIWIRELPANDNEG